jgi:hypothetical protein
MKRIIVASTLLLLAPGCHGEFEIRKEPDLWEVTPPQAWHLRLPGAVQSNVNQISAPSEWQIHTSLANRHALTDKDSSTVALSLDDHRRGEYILIDLGCLCRFQIVRQLHPSDLGHPPRFRVDTAGEHGFPYTLRYLGTGQSGESNAVFGRLVDARFIKITIIENSSSPWAVSELVIE